MNRGEGLIYKRTGGGTERLRLGFDDLSWLDNYNAARARARRLAHTLTVGLVLPQAADSRFTGAWRVYEDPSTAGNLLIGADSGQAQAFIDGEGYEVIAAQEFEPYSLTPPKGGGIAVPNDGQWYTLVVRRGLTEYEPGTLQFTASSANIVGTGTDFTEYAGKTDEGLSVGTQILVDSSDAASVAGTYELSTVTTATQATATTTAAANASGVPFRLAGHWANSTPANPARSQRLVPEFELLDSQREPGTTGGAAGDFILADVKRSGGTLVVVDRRHQNVYRPAMPGGARAFASTISQPVLEGDPDTHNLLQANSQLIVTLTELTTHNLSLCRFTDGGMLAVVSDTSNGVRNYIFDPYTQTWGSAHVIDASGDYGDVIALDNGAGGLTYLCVYVKSDQLYKKTSADGATWSSAVLIWDPQSVDPSDTMDGCTVRQLDNNRILVVGWYYDDSAPGYSHRVVWSDDYGTSWDTNSDEGIEVIPSGSAPTNRPSVAQCPVSRRIYLGSEGNFANTFPVYYTADPLGETGWTDASDGSNFEDNAVSDIYSPCLWVGPDQLIHLLYGCRQADSGGSGGFYEVREMTLSFYPSGVPLRYLDRRRVIRCEDSAGATSTSGVCASKTIHLDAHQARSGLVMLAFNDKDLGASPNDHATSMWLAPHYFPVLAAGAEEPY